MRKFKISNNWKTILLFCLTLLPIVVMIIGLSIGFHYDALLANYNKTTKGVVIKRLGGRKSDVNIMYRFEVENQQYIRSSQINNFENNMDCFFYVGDSVFIKYYPPDPELCEVDLEASYKRWKKPKPIRLKFIDSLLGIKYNKNCDLPIDTTWDKFVQ